MKSLAMQVRLSGSRIFTGLARILTLHPGTRTDEAFTRIFKMIKLQRFLSVVNLFCNYLTYFLKF